jgi:hypothetical protein
MLVLILSWLLMLILVTLIGLTILKVLKIANVLRHTDTFFVSQWLGIIFIINFLLAVSLFAPLNPLLVTILLTLVWVICFILLGRKLSTIHEIIAINKTEWVIFLGVCVFVSAFISKDVLLFDSGNYHYQTIQWLSQYGAVKGVSLINSHIGFYPSWFTLPSAFDHGDLQGRMLAVGNGYITVIMILQFVQSILALKKNQEIDRLPSLFIAIFVPLAFYTPSEYGLVMSPSPDVPVIYLIGFFCWLLLLLRHNNSLQDYGLPFLFLGVGAMTIKLSAVPLAIMGILIFVRSKGKFLVNLVIAGLVAFLLLLPSFAYGVIATGCPFFPSGIACIDVPWGYGSVSTSKLYEEGIRLGNAQQEWTGLVGTDNFVIFTLAIISALLGLFFIARKTRFFIEEISYRYPVYLCLIGLGFVLYSAPNFRFYWGYLVSLSALSISVYLLHHPLRLSLGIGKKLPAKYAKYFWLMFLVIWTLLYQKDTNFYILPAHIRVPPSNPVPSVNNDFVYNVPAPEVPYRLCWGIKIPCPFPASASINNDVKLLHPESGLSGGFTRRLVKDKD